MNGFCWSDGLGDGLGDGLSNRIGDCACHFPGLRHVIGLWFLSIGFSWGQTERDPGGVEVSKELLLWLGQQDCGIQESLIVSKRNLDG